jgi:hypothetical protein
MINDMEGVYTRTQAYNFLKDLLGVSRRKVLLPKKFFFLFFKESDGMYFIKKPEDIVRDIIKKEGIDELNNQYHKNKQEKNLDEAEKISEKVMRVVKKDMLAA